MASVPVWQFAGEWDSTAGTDSPKRTQKALEEAGNKNAKLTILKADHSALSTQPFNAELLKWFLSNSGKGSASSSSDSSSSDSSSSSDDSESSSDKESTSTSSSDKSDKSDSSSKSESQSESSKASTGTKTNPKSSSRCKSGSSKKARKLRAKRSAGIAHRSLSLTAMLAGRQSAQSASGPANAKRSFMPGPASASAPAPSTGTGTGAILAARDVLAPHPMNGESVLQRRDPALVAREALRQTAGSRVGAARRR